MQDECVFDIWQSKLFLDLHVVAPEFKCLTQHNFPCSTLAISAVKTTRRSLLAMENVCQPCELPNVAWAQTVLFVLIAVNNRNGNGI